MLAGSQFRTLPEKTSARRSAGLQALLVVGADRSSGLAELLPGE